MASPRIISYIGSKEGFVSKWYLDPVHIPTIGYRFTSDGCTGFVDAWRGVDLSGCCRAVK